MVGNPLLLSPRTSLEEALLRLCAAKTEVAMVIGEGKKLAGVAGLRDLMVELERWYERQTSTSKKKKGVSSEGTRLTGLAADGDGGLAAHEIMQVCHDVCMTRFDGRHVVNGVSPSHLS